MREARITVGASPEALYDMVADVVNGQGPTEIVTRLREGRW